MKILLLVPPTFYGNATPSLGISYVASFVLAHCPSTEVRMIDFGVEPFSWDRLRKELTDYLPNILGISSTILDYSYAIRIADFVKAHYPSVLVVLGGPQATALAEDCTKHCDAVVRGEGEVTFSEIVRGRPFQETRGLSYLEDGKTIHNPPREPIDVLDALPFPALHLLKIREYAEFKTLREMHVIGSRGCPFNCTFCFSPFMWGRRLRLRSPKNVVDEIESLKRNYGCKIVFFNDDALNLPSPKRAMDICDEIVSRGLHKEMRFITQLRANRQLISKELFQSLKQAGFMQIGFGVESGSPLVLRSMRKNLPIEDVKYATRISHESGFNPFCFFIIGSWNESILDLFRTWKLILSAKLSPSFQIMIPIPGTDLWQTLKENGFLSDLDWSKIQTSEVLPVVGPIVRTNRMTKRQIYIAFRVTRLCFSMKSKMIDRTEPYPEFQNLGRFLTEVLRGKRPTSVAK